MLPISLYWYSKSIFLTIVLSVAGILFSEIIFLVLYKKLFNSSYKMTYKIPFEKIYVEPHPYLPYVYKKNFKTSDNNTIANYPLHQGKYTFETLFSRWIEREIPITIRRQMMDIPTSALLLILNWLYQLTVVI
jgi:hypothetical protein